MSTQIAPRRKRAVLLGVLSVLAVAPRLATAQPQAAGKQSSGQNPVSVPITGTFQLGGVTQQLPNTAVFVVEKFANQNGQLVAIGALRDSANPTDPGLPLTLPVADPPSGTCSVLDLTLGPLHLDLLGLVIDLNQVHLTITAQQAPGNLLGNLLCAVTNLLNGTGAGGANLNAVANLLNNILALL
jgi:hypothetical protein